MIEHSDNLINRLLTELPEFTKPASLPDSLSAIIPTLADFMGIKLIAADHEVDPKQIALRKHALREALIDTLYPGAEHTANLAVENIESKINAIATEVASHTGTPMRRY